MLSYSSLRNLVTGEKLTIKSGHRHTLLSPAGEDHPLGNTEFHFSGLEIGNNHDLHAHELFRFRIGGTNTCEYLSQASLPQVHHDPDQLSGVFHKCGLLDDTYTQINL